MSMDVNSPEAAQWSENLSLKSENEFLRSALPDIMSLCIAAKVVAMNNDATRAEMSALARQADLVKDFAIRATNQQQAERSK